MELGAVDYVAKPGGTVSLNIQQVFPDLVDKVRSAYRARRLGRLQSHRQSLASAPSPRAGRASAPPSSVAAAEASADLVLIGVSTGGARALEVLIAELPGNWPVPILIAQHMPARFTGVFAERLNERCEIAVEEVARPIPLAPGRVYVGRGDADLVVARRLNRLTAISVSADAAFSWHPSVSRMVASAMEVVPPHRLIGVQLTGMGDDGAREMAALHLRGGRTIAEAEETATIFGMPKELIQRGGASKVLPAHRIVPQLERWIGSAANAA
jgi:two-component system chemotaxis response regulator CheB